MNGDPYTYEGLKRQNEEMKEEVMRLKHEVEVLRGEAKEGKIVRFFGKKKGEGASYDILKVNYQHRKILYGLLLFGAASKETGIPAIQLRKELKMGQGPLSGRIAEMIRKGYVSCEKAKVSFQQDASGSWQYRPEVETDPRTSVRKYKRFLYFITESGKNKLIETVRPNDGFVKLDLNALIELKYMAKAKELIEKKQGMPAEKTHVLPETHINCKPLGESQGASETTQGRFETHTTRNSGAPYWVELLEKIENEAKTERRREGEK